MTLKPIGQRVKEVRESQGMKSKFLAHGIGKSPSWLSSIENGKTTLPADMIQPICSVLGITVSFLFEENILETRIHAFDEQAASSA